MLRLRFYDNLAKKRSIADQIDQLLIFLLLKIYLLKSNLSISIIQAIAIDFSPK